MPRLVRQRPLSERIQAILNPGDLFLWLSEEIETRELGSKSVGTQLGLALNFVFLLARANSGASRDVDDVFSDSSGSGWLSHLLFLIVWSLVGFSVANFIYTFRRCRSYRLFEANIEQKPETPSAHRVRVQSSPVSSSPLRMLTDILEAGSAESRAYPDRSRDVWELELWDPLPASLQLVCLFSPLHILIYMLNLPLPALDPRPSVTVFKCLVEQAVLSALLLGLETRFSQQNKDAAIIQKWVMREYDTKYVHPRLHPIMRDVGTQFGTDDAGHDLDYVEVGTPTFLISRGFQTHPNQNYVKHFDPDSASRKQPSAAVTDPVLRTPAGNSRHSDSFASSRSTLRQSMPASTPAFSDSSSAAPGSKPNSGFGGNLGVYTHANSPLKKAISLSDMNGSAVSFSPKNSRELAAVEQRDLMDRMQRRSSPFKEDRGATTSSQAQGPEQSPNPFAGMGMYRGRHERFPSRR
ncbi:hypothetical protein NKR23_g4515 [Pleurostoma richardsiae]|uniref:Meiotically up-regulated gene 154 protein n=1 Tax=Pleurostoma richardsiae TaxID=41990 RepID=A0AA38VV30_9PEZI|nr:hypothetical protein NKR23_g4515 [Pleurostoma richardsiae]